MPRSAASGAGAPWSHGDQYFGEPQVGVSRDVTKRLQDRPDRARGVADVLQQLGERIPERQRRAVPLFRQHVINHLRAMQDALLLPLERIDLDRRYGFPWMLVSSRIRVSQASVLRRCCPAGHWRPRRFGLSESTAGFCKLAIWSRPNEAEAAVPGSLLLSFADSTILDAKVLRRRHLHRRAVRYVARGERRVRRLTTTLRTK